MPQDQQSDGAAKAVDGDGEMMESRIPALITKGRKFLQNGGAPLQAIFPVLEQMHREYMEKFTNIEENFDDVYAFMEEQDVPTPAEFVAAVIEHLATVDRFLSFTFVQCGYYKVAADGSVDTGALPAVIAEALGDMQQRSATLLQLAAQVSEGADDDGDDGAGEGA